MRRRDFLRIAGAAAIGPGLAGALPARVAAVPQPARWPGYDGALVFDALGGPIQFNIPQEGLPLRPGVLDQVRASGITGVNLTVNARPEGDLSAYEATTAKMAAWDAEIDAHAEVLVRVRSVDELRAAKEGRRLGIVYGFQDAVPFEDDLARLDAFHRAGVRIVQLTYNVRNRVGSGCLAQEDGGLTELGREVVDRLDRLRVLVDLSHCGPRTTLEGLSASTRPVAVTHSGCSAVFAHPRNKDDDTLRRLARRGGVFGVYLMPFLNPSGPPSAGDVVRHLEHALDVCGEDHVGIGSDQGIVPLDVSGDFQARFDQVSAQRAAAGIAAPREDTIPYVPELDTPRRMERIADLLGARGHPDRVIEKVLGANWVRLLGEVWG